MSLRLIKRGQSWHLRGTVRGIAIRETTGCTEREEAEEGSFEIGIRLALQTVLVSPEFLFRMEFDPPGVERGSAYRISDLELAARLSFFLWSTLPDEKLPTLAEANQLSDPNILEAQVLNKVHQENLAIRFF